MYRAFHIDLKGHTRVLILIVLCIVKGRSNMTRSRMVVTTTIRIILTCRMPS
jgi:hypothetical protein